MTPHDRLKLLSKALIQEQRTMVEKLSLVDDCFALDEIQLIISFRENDIQRAISQALMEGFSKAISTNKACRLEIATRDRNPVIKQALSIAYLLSAWLIAARYAVFVLRVRLYFIEALRQALEVAIEYTKDDWSQSFAPIDSPIFSGTPTLPKGDKPITLEFACRAIVFDLIEETKF